MSQFGIHWFRRDLRIAGNSALKQNWKKTHGKTLGVFFFDQRFLSRPDFSSNRFGFFLNSLKELQTEIREMGGDLLVIDQSPQEGWTWLLSQLKNYPTLITWNRDYEPFARKRDEDISQMLLKSGIEIQTERDHLLIEPNELYKDPEALSYYQVYTPFSKRWHSILLEPEIQRRISSQKESLQYLEKRDHGQKIDPIFSIKWGQVWPNSDKSDSLDRFIQTEMKRVTIPLPPAGSLQAYRVAKQFTSQVDRYLELRDFPSQRGTSGLSIYFKNGSITSAMVLQMFHLNQTPLLIKSGKTQFLKELIWREFYYHILYHRPDAEYQAFLPHYRDIRWENRQDWFEAWKEGRTGYPIVDAGMRELKATGLMHNRLRMIVASFLTKDLLIDWKWGEQYFMRQLLDGDLAPNNGGWQWAASTGCDPQPYFRIFNPALQSEKFDPDGHYIKKFVPELSKVPAKEIHESPHTYFHPIVNHAKQKEKVLSLYKRN